MYIMIFDITMISPCRKRSETKIRIGHTRDLLPREADIDN